VHVRTSADRLAGIANVWMVKHVWHLLNLAARTNEQDFRSAEKIMAKITTPKTHIKYAKAKEKQGQYKEAADAYEKGKDTESLVRLCLEHLQLPQRAFSIVRETRETASAMDIVKYTLKTGDFRSAIEFLLIAKENEKAIETAREHDMMDSLALFLGKDGTRSEYMEIARHYKSKKQPEQAAEYYEKAGQFKDALDLFLQVGEKAIDKAIDVVGAARNDVLTHTLVDYLMGEHDREPKDPNYIFRLYMALGNFRQAARTAVIIAKQEQEEGNYKSAHKLLFDTFKDMESQNIPVSRSPRGACPRLSVARLCRARVRREKAASTFGNACACAECGRCTLGCAYAHMVWRPQGLGGVAHVAAQLRARQVARQAGRPRHGCQLPPHPSLVSLHPPSLVSPQPSAGAGATALPEGDGGKVARPRMPCKHAVLVLGAPQHSEGANASRAAMPMGERAKRAPTCRSAWHAKCPRQRRDAAGIQWLIQ